MTKLIEKYISQIKKKLLNKKVSQVFVDEFLDNLEDQLYSMYDEILVQEPGLSSEDAEVTVLSNCEPVKKIVERVIQEYHSKDIIPSMNVKELPTELKFLYPVESLLIKVSKGLDNLLLKIATFTHDKNQWFKLHENPIFTSILCVLFIFISVGVIQTLFFLFPGIYQVTVYPSNQNYFYLSQHGDVPSYITQNPSVTGMSVTSVSQYVQVILSGLIVIGIFLYLGYSRSIKLSVPTAIFISFIFSAIAVITSHGYRLTDIVNRSVNKTSRSYSPDWYYTYIPSPAEYLDFFIQSIVIHIFLLFLSFILSLVLIGSLIKTLKTRNFPSPLTISVSKNLTKVLFILICIGITTIIPRTYPVIPSPNVDYPLPGRDLPVYYKFNTKPEGVSSWPHSVTQAINFPEFGNMSFIWYAIFGMEFEAPISTSLGINSKAKLIISWDEEEDLSSQSTFFLFGSFFFPNNTANHDWIELVNNDLNSSYPFSGFTPYANISQNYIPWHVNGVERNISVNTVVYSSITNQSQYSFYFDPVTGFLLQADLVSSTDWISGYNTKLVTIQRIFNGNVINDASDFVSLDFNLSTAVIFSISILFLLGGLYYLREQKRLTKKAHNKKK